MVISKVFSLEINFLESSSNFCLLLLAAGMVHSCSTSILCLGQKSLRSSVTAPVSGSGASTVYHVAGFPQVDSLSGDIANVVINGVVARNNLIDD